MTRRKYVQHVDNPTFNSHNPSQLPINKPVAVYYRQSSEAQVGNISTAMQTIDLPDYLKRLGWAENKIILIDTDAGISGTTKIDERPGMRQLFDLIIDERIGAVACQDEDRLFRDLTQIQVNIFIQACLEANVQVITPSVTYDFAHSTMGTFHARQFRFKSEMSAEYITSYIRGRLQPARARLIMDGLWAGASVPPGYIIDIRKTLPDGSHNPNWRKYTPFEPFVEVVNEYFQIFILKGGNLKQSADHIRVHGPYYPDWDDPEVQRAVPEGFKLVKPYNIKRSERGYTPDDGSLGRLFTSAIYRGHWITRGQVVKWNNHPPIVPEDVFMRAFNYLSPTNFDGTPNLDYRPRKRNERPTLDKRRNQARPLCEGVLFSCEDEVWRPAGVQWSHQSARYAYAFLSGGPNNPVLWYKQACYIDEVVTLYLQDKLRATFNPESWDAIVASFGDEHEQERRRTLKQITSLERDMERLIGNLAKLTNEQMIAKAQNQYEQYEVEKLRLRTKLTEFDTVIAQRQTLLNLRDSYSPAVDNWVKLTLDEQRLILHVFLDRIDVITLPNQGVRVIMQWRDNSSDQVDIPRKGTTYTQWLASESSRLIELLEQNATQIEIASEFPTRKWQHIRVKIQTLDKRFSSYFAPKLIRDTESYYDYLKRLERIELSGVPKRSNIRDRWLPHEVALLNKLLDEGATQLDFVKAFPRRNWDGVRRKITVERGKDFKVEGVHEVERYESYAQYCIRKQQDAELKEKSSMIDAPDTDQRWQPEEVQTLARMIDEGAMLLDLLKALPKRNWEGIRRKVARDLGRKLNIEIPPHLTKYETYDQYYSRMEEATGYVGELSLTHMTSEDSLDKVRLYDS